MKIYITAIRTSPVGSQDHSEIAQICWLDPAAGVSKTMSKRQTVEWLRESSDNEAWVGGADGPAKVQVVEVEPPYIRTAADGEWSNNLLALPRF